MLDSELAFPLSSQYFRHHRALNDLQAFLNHRPQSFDDIPGPLINSALLYMTLTNTIITRQFLNFLISRRLASRLDEAVDDGCEASTGAAVTVITLDARRVLAKDEVRHHRALALHLDRSTLLRLVASRMQVLQITRTEKERQRGD